jgi:hypothetical protein
MKTFEKWFAGMISAALSGGGTTAVGAFAVPELLYAPGGFEKLGIMFAGGAIIGVLNYLKRSPLDECLEAIAAEKVEKKL